MPKGVEHLDVLAPPAASETVRLSVMPKGVEHRQVNARSMSLSLCDFQ